MVRAQGRLIALNVDIDVGVGAGQDFMDAVRPRRMLAGQVNRNTGGLARLLYLRAGRRYCQVRQKRRALGIQVDPVDHRAARDFPQRFPRQARRVEPGGNHAHDFEGCDHK